MDTIGRNSKLILQIHGEPFGDDMKAVVPNLSSGAKSFEEAKALKSGTAGFVGAMNEIMHFNAMLVVLLSQHHGEHVLEYTADERDNVKTSDIWQLALGAFPAYRARDRHEARRVGGTLVQSSSESRRVPPKITPLLSEVLTLEHWKWSKLRVTTARDRSPIVVCCRLGSLAKSVLACAFKQVPVAIKNRLVLCRRWCAMQRLNQLLSAAYVTCAGAEVAENDVADLLHKRDPGLYYDLMPSSGSLEFLTGLLIELGIKVNHRGGAKGINVIMDIAPRLGKDANLGTKALVPSIGVLPVVPKVQSKVASLLVAVGSASRFQVHNASLSDSLDERNARWLALLANGADSTKLHLAWNARVRENQSALQHEKTNSMRKAEIKLEGEAKIRVAKPKFKSSQSKSSSKDNSTGTITVNHFDRLDMGVSEGHEHGNFSLSHATVSQRNVDRETHCITLVEPSIATNGACFEYVQRDGETIIAACKPGEADALGFLKTSNHRVGALTRLLPRQIPVGLTYFTSESLKPVLCKKPLASDFDVRREGVMIRPSFGLARSSAQTIFADLAASLAPFNALTARNRGTGATQHRHALLDTWELGNQNDIKVYGRFTSAGMRGITEAEVLQDHLYEVHCKANGIKFESDVVAYPFWQYSDGCEFLKPDADGKHNAEQLAYIDVTTFEIKALNKTYQAEAPHQYADQKRTLGAPFEMVVPCGTTRESFMADQNVIDPTMCYASDRGSQFVWCWATAPYFKKLLHTGHTWNGGAPVTIAPKSARHDAIQVQRDGFICSAHEMPITIVDIYRSNIDSFAGTDAYLKENILAKAGIVYSSHTLKYALKLEFKGDTVLAVNTFARSLWYAVPHTLRPRLLALALACSALTSSVLAFPRVWLVTGAPTPMTIAKRSLRLLTSRRMLP